MADQLLLLYEFGKHSNANDALRSICDAMGPSTFPYDATKV